jgi:RNA recognition motif-containing protein
MANIVNRGAGAPGTGTKVATKTPTYPPNQTQVTVPSQLLNQTANVRRLYITNLPSSKFQKTDLRISLYSLFSTYGPVIDVVALKTQKMSGQAHVVFRDIQTSTQAMRALQGFEFFGKELVRLLLPKTRSYFHTNSIL